MATESFYEDMVIDTPEKARALEDLLENGKPYLPEHTDIVIDDPEALAKLKNKFER